MFKYLKSIYNDMDTNYYGDELKYLFKKLF